MTESSPPTLEPEESIAIVGVSRRRTKFGAIAYRALKDKGFTVFAIHPNLNDFDGDPCYRSLLDIKRPVDTVLVAAKPARIEDVVEQCCRIGARCLWFQQGGDYARLAQRAEDVGIQVVRDKCLLMYARNVGGIHAVHRYIWKLIGKF
jgi:predicted CoA-binding protein